VLDVGQEEVFSRTEVELGRIEHAPGREEPAPTSGDVRGSIDPQAEIAATPRPPGVGRRNRGVPPLVWIILTLFGGWLVLVAFGAWT
jgi:hypothetical protein